jgi:hypothetical protein
LRIVRLACAPVFRCFAPDRLHSDNAGIWRGMPIGSAWPRGTPSPPHSLGSLGVRPVGTVREASSSSLPAGHVKARQSVQPSGATNFPQLQVGGGRNQGKSIPVLCRPCRRVLGSHRLTVRWCPRGRRPIASKTVVVIALLGNMIDVADRRRLGPHRISKHR